MSRAWSELQASFAAAVADPACAAPATLIQCGGRGLDVYRNNVVSGLIDALRGRFPVTAQLVGDEFFRALARVFVHRHWPKSPRLLEYGEELPAFITRFPPAQSVAYLTDIALLEVARHRACHAAEGACMTADVLKTLEPESLPAMRIALHPSLHLVRSPFPIAQIWAAHHCSDDAAAPPQWCAEDVMIVRPDVDVRMHTLPEGAYAFVTALAQRACVEDAANAALVECEHFDAGAHLVGLFQLGAVVALDRPD